MYSVIQQWSNSDRANQYGDGIFSTMRCVDYRVELKSYHIARIHRDALRIGLPAIDVDLDAIIDEFAGKHGNHVIKLMLSAGEGGRGYARPNSVNGHIMLSAFSLPAHYSAWKEKGITVGVSDIKLAQQPLLAGVKHLNRLEQVLIKQAMPNNVDDVLVCDSQNHIIEASSANVFWLKDEQWYTPSLHHCGVDGVKRQQILDYLSHAGRPVKCSSVSINEITGFSAMFICNALMGIIPVHTLTVSSTCYRMDIAPACQLDTKINEWQAFA